SSNSTQTTSTVAGPPVCLMRNARWDASNSSNMRRTESLRHSSHTVTNPDMRSDPPLTNLLDESRNAAQRAEASAAACPTRDFTTGHRSINLLTRNPLHIPHAGRGSAYDLIITNGVATSTRIAS